MFRKPLMVALVFVGLLGIARAKSYDFAVPPVQALEALAKLKQLSTGRQAVSADETALFADAADAKLDQLSYAEAALIVSGVVDAEKRKPYLAKLDQIEADARKAVGDAKTAAEKGERLLAFLHAGPMKAGYATRQSLLDVLLDTGKFNCVSSAVFYNILALRLGLDARGVLVTGHAFSVIHDGDKAMDVETTTRRGFNPRDPDVLKELEERTGQKRTTDRRQRREVRELGLIASIYANRGADLCGEKKFYEALLVDFAALALDRDGDTGVQNAHAALTQWTKHLIEQKQFEACLAVAAVGREIAPSDSTLRGNREACWQEWIKHTHAVGGEEAARKLAFRLFEENRGEKVIQEIVRGHVVREMKKFQADKKYEQALTLVIRNRDLLGQDREVENLKAFCWQEWIKTANQEGEEPARKLITRLIQDSPGEKGLQEAVRNHVIRGTNKLKDAKKYEEALAYVARHQEVLRDADEVKKLDLVVYDAWAFSYRPTKNWQAGIKVYKAALEKYPGDRHLSHNLKYFEQESKK